MLSVKNGQKWGRRGNVLTQSESNIFKHVEVIPETDCEKLIPIP